jgi:N-acetylglutamate synthase-like GNAT family acetyltransferase
VEQVSVHPTHAGQGLGRTLVDTVDRCAGESRLIALTFTAYADVPWDPRITGLGFEIIDDADLTPGLREIRAAEAAHELDGWPRVVMRRPVTVTRSETDRRG